jgi:hypothetical protein
MGLDEWKAKRRERELVKVNKELEELKQKGLAFENKLLCC